MRMWKVNPKKMCRQHLLGEHVELHMFVGSIRKGINIQKFTDTELVEVHNIRKRHDILVKEMIRRGYNHRSPMRARIFKRAGKIDVKANERELARRCKDCQFRSDRGLPRRRRRRR